MNKTISLHMNVLTLIAVLVILLTAEISQARHIPDYGLTVRFDIPESRLNGVAEVSMKAGERQKLFKGNLIIDSATFNGEPIGYDENAEYFTLNTGSDGVVRIAYHGVFRAGQHRDRSSGPVASIIDERGISLTGFWYPSVDGLSRFSLKAELPAGYEAVSEAENITKERRGENEFFTFTFEHPLDNLNFVASDRFTLLTDTHRGVELMAYFFPEDAQLARQYLDYTKKYLDLYHSILGEFPYKRFSVVENFLPTGYSMPTFTLLGSSVVRLPFIVETSLGHEILHQWFGNYAYVDYENGNWSEAITSYLADHAYKEADGKGWEYRKQTLIDYMSYVEFENDMPLREFTGRVDYATRAIGYGKGVMVFHMLKNIVGEYNFHESLRYFLKKNRFRQASWVDLRNAFELVSIVDLEEFFAQWIDRTGLPEIVIKDIDVRQEGNRFNLSFTLHQKGTVYTLHFPVALHLPRETITLDLILDQQSQSYSFTLPERPERIAVDEHYDIARRLAQDEHPVVLAALFGEERVLLVYEGEDKQKYETVIEGFRRNGAVIKRTEEIGTPDILDRSLVILGQQNLLLKKMYGSVDMDEAGFSVQVKKNPWNADKVVAIINGMSLQEVERSFRKIYHYGKYTNLYFQNGRNTGKEIQETQRGVTMDLPQDTVAVNIAALQTMTDVIDGVKDKRIVYVGEMHDVFAHHAVQLDIITGLYKYNGNIAIGMEMFQRPFQNILDQYVKKTISEQEFLLQSEYFKRWKFDYNLYKPILDFARAENVPLIALNMEREIINKVSVNGIDGLSEEERNALPEELDFSDKRYRDRLEEVFKFHASSEEKKFEHFLQSQILWDETMSESVDAFMQKSPDHRIIVLAGRGHLEYGSGIPKRTFRRNGIDYATVLIDSELEPGIADFVLFPKTVEGEAAPRLMVFLKEEDGKLIISGFPEGSVSEKAGLLKEDTLLQIDDIEITGIDVVKVHLQFKSRGEKVRVNVGRDVDGKETQIAVEVML